MKHRCLQSLLIILLVPFYLNAQTLAIKASRMLDVKSGKLISPALILVQDGLIIAINPESIPENTKTIHLKDKTLLPGLIDLHTHLTSDLIDGWEYQASNESPADWALRGARNAKLTLYAGFTTVRDLWNLYGFTDVALMNAIDKNLIEGPHIIPCGHALGITGGHMDITGLAPGILETNFKMGIADGVAEVTKAVRYQIKHGAKVIKIAATSGVMSFEKSAGAQQYTFEEMKAIVDEADRHHIRVAAHALGTDGIIAASNAGVISIEHGSILNETAIQTLIKNKTYLIPTMHLVGNVDESKLPPQLILKNRYIDSMAILSFKMAIKSKVKMAFGTDAGLFPHGENAKEFIALVKFGMSPIEAIRGATLYANDVLGYEDRGELKVGYLADIIAVSGNPLEDINLLEQVEFVMKSGKIYKQE